LRIFSSQQRLLGKYFCLSQKERDKKGRQCDLAAFFDCSLALRQSPALDQHIRRQRMQGMGEGGENCPFEFNFDPATFKPGDEVSYRVTGSLEGFPFVGTLVEVHDDYVILCPGESEPGARYRGTRESRPLVDESEVLKL
jgi:hypothetical protein